MDDPISQLFERLEELERRVGQMVVRGIIAEVHEEKPLARVKYGENLTTGWITWKPIRTGKAIVWWCPEVGEGVTVISSGNVSQGEIFPGSYYDDFPAPSNNPNQFLIEFGDGSLISHDRESGEYNLMMQGNIHIASHKDLNINIKGNAGIVCDGDITAQANNIIADAKKIKLNGGAGCVTGESICHFTGSPHADCSKAVFAGK